MRLGKTLFLVIAWISVVALACNLTATDEPATIAPNPQPPGVTPQPTVGIEATLAPDELPAATRDSQSSYDVQMFNLLSEIQGDRLMMHVCTLEEFYTRHINSSLTDASRGMGAARAYLFEQFKAIEAQAPQHFQVFVQPFSAYANDTEGNSIESVQQNIIGYLGGTETGAGTIVIGAHYDSRTDDLRDGTGFAPGADDNGSGVAAILEMARVLSQRPQRASIIFVLFSAEEHGRQGSSAFVQEYIIGRSIDMTAMINVDTIGSWNAPDGSRNAESIRLYSDDDVTNTSATRQLARNINFLAFNHGLNLDITVMPAQDRDGRYGDHFSFQERGYPAVRFIEAVEDTPNREGRDTCNHVEAAYLTDSTRTIMGVLWAMAGGLRPPDARNMVLRETDQVHVDSGGLQRDIYQLVWNAVPGATGYVVALRRPGALIYQPQFTVSTNETFWWRFGDFEAVAIAAIDQNGMVGPLSAEYSLNLP